MSSDGAKAAPSEIPTAAMQQEAYMNWRTAAKTYRNHKGTPMGMSPGLLRARQQYRIPNAITGVLVTAFVVGVYWYSIAAVKQDNFDDVDEEARAMFAEGRRTTTNSAPLAVPSEEPLSKTLTTTAPRGVLSSILERAAPGALDPQRKTLVWGAPPVDAIGRLSDRRR